MSTSYQQSYEQLHFFTAVSPQRLDEKNFGSYLIDSNKNS